MYVYIYTYIYIYIWQRPKTYGSASHTKTLGAPAMVRRPKHYDCGVLRRRPVRRPSVARRLLKQTLATNGDAPGYAPTRFGKPVDFGKPVAFNLGICAAVCTTYIYIYIYVESELQAHRIFE